MATPNRNVEGLRNDGYFTRLRDLLRRESFRDRTGGDPRHLRRERTNERVLEQLEAQMGKVSARDRYTLRGRIDQARREINRVNDYNLGRVPTPVAGRHPRGRPGNSI